jgi:p-cumate 2,3-dioxygenase subunit beta
MNAALPERLWLRLQIEDFLYHEAALLDAWKLRDWFALFTPDGRYEIAPTGEEDRAQLKPADALFLVADDHERLEQRIIRLLKPSAHAEYPHSQTRHLYSNIRITAIDEPHIEVSAHFVIFRNKRGVTATYMGEQLYRLRREGDSFRIQSKRSVLDLDALVPQGKVSILL